MTEDKEHDKLFADLDALTEQQIEVGLAAGVWKVQVRALVQHYLYDLMLKLPLTDLLKWRRRCGWQLVKLSKRRRERVRP